MNRNVERAVFFAAGIILGGGAVYVVSKQHYRKLTEEEVASVRDSFKKIYEAKAARLAEGTTHPGLRVPEDDVDPEEENSEREEYSVLVRTLEYDSTETPNIPELVKKMEDEYSKKEVTDPRPPLTEEYFKQFVDVDPEADIDPDAPYMIDSSDFFTSDNDTMTLTYWESSNTLVDERDIPIMDVDKYVGIHNLQVLAEMTGNDPSIYVRNDAEGLDYEIILDRRNYTQIVMGFSDDPDEYELNQHKRIKKMRSDGV